MSRVFIGTDEMMALNQILRIDMGFLYELKNQIRICGYEPTSWVLPMPELEIMGLPVIFANVKAPTMEIKTRAASFDPEVTKE